MKRYIVFEAAKYASQNISRQKKDRWKRKLKIVAGVAVLSIFVVGGLGIWGAVVVVNKLAGSVDAAAVQQGLEKGRVGLGAVLSQPITTQNCLNIVGSMLSPSKLLTVPIAQSLESMRGACWDGLGQQQIDAKES